MKVLNGYAVIDHAKNSLGDTVILAFTVHQNGSFEYVTALVTSLDAEEWFFGHYYVTLTHALEDFKRRSDAALTTK